nr:RHS repeat-associated core domain-containing protein [Desulfovibrio sp. UCD-KL4C]
MHFGHREYDPAIGRFITPDPIGFAGGDVDVYGYCLDDPINFYDRTGLFKFGKRRLGGLVSKESKAGKTARAITRRIIKISPLGGIAVLIGEASSDKVEKILDEANFELYHEHGFYEDGSGDNVGFFKGGTKDNGNIDPEEYPLIGNINKKKNNSQDYADRLRKRYEELEL